MDDRTTFDLDHDDRYTGASALVVLGGDLAPTERLLVPPHAVVIAADSGIDHAHRLGLAVDIAIGDFDSVTPGGLEQVRRRGARVSRHPVEKDATDFELALEAALALGVSRVVVVGGEGGRLDHLLANALVMASPRYERLTITSFGGDGARVHVVRGVHHLEGEPGEIVTLLAVNGPADGVSTIGLRYPLRGELLAPGSSRGVSNQLLDREATVSVASGVVLAVLPGSRHRLAVTDPDPSKDPDDPPTS